MLVTVAAAVATMAGAEGGRGLWGERGQAREEEEEGGVGGVEFLRRPAVRPFRLPPLMVVRRHHRLLRPLPPRPPLRCLGRDYLARATGLRGRWLMMPLGGDATALQEEEEEEEDRGLGAGHPGRGDRRRHSRMPGRCSRGGV